VKYCVHCAGWPSDADTWELEEQLEGCQELVQEFKWRTEQRRKTKKKSDESEKSSADTEQSTSSTQ